MLQHCTGAGPALSQRFPTFSRCVSAGGIVCFRVHYDDGATEVVVCISRRDAERTVAAGTRGRG